MATTSVSFPEPVSFVIELSIPAFSSKKSQTTAIVSKGVSACGSTWTVEVIPLEKATVGEKKVDCVSVYLVRRILPTESDRSDIHVSSQISFVNVNNGSSTKMVPPIAFCPLEQLFSVKPGEHCTRWVKHPILEHLTIWGDSPIVLLRDDVLTVEVRATCKLLGENQKYRAPIADFLREKSKKMACNTTARDFVLVSAEGKERAVHKLVLLSSSLVFQRMLESNLEECKTGRCEISDIDSATLDGLIRFMYTGCVEKVKDNARNLLVAADKYQIQALKDHCEDALLKELNADNVVDLLMFAEKMSAPELKKAALRYMADDPQKTLAWPSTQTLFASADRDLITEVFTAMLKLPTK